MTALFPIKTEKTLEIGVYGLILGFMYSFSFRWLVMRDWAREDFSFGYFIPVVVLYLIWEKRTAVAGLESVPSWTGMVPFGLGIVLFWLGELSGEVYSLYISSWLVLVGVCWMNLGWKKVKVISFPLMFVLAMFPLPNFIFTKISVQLKLLSSRLGVVLMQLYGMSAFREGNVIDVGFTKLQVVDACSGLRYLIPLVVMAILIAYLSRTSFWKKTLLVISAVPLSIITNSLRIASVGILYQFFGPRVAEGFFHDFSGWVIFMVSLGMLLFEMWLLQRIFRGQTAHGSTARAEVPETVTSRHDPDRGEWYRLKPPQFVVTVILLLVTIALSHGIEFREKTPVKKAFMLFPQQIAEWTGIRQGMEQMYVEELGLSDYMIVDYSNRQGKSINFYTAYSDSQRKGKSTHTPATCLPGSGWNVIDSGTTAVRLANSETMPVSRVLMEKNGATQLVYYWFPQRGRILTSLYQLKLFGFWDALTRQRTDGALVRLITPVYSNERLEATEARLMGFTRLIVPVLTGYLPGKERI